MPILNIKSNSPQIKQRGSVIVEFALVIIPLLLIVAGIVEFGRTFWYYDALVKATRDAARYVSDTRVSDAVGVDNSLKAQARTMVRNAAVAANVPDFSEELVGVECEPADCEAPNYVTVSILDYPVTIGGWIPIIFPANGTWDTTLSPSTTMRYMK